MFLDLSAGTFLWHWTNSWAPLNAMSLALVAATLVVFMTKWTPGSSLIKIIVTAGVLASMPLGLAKMGILIPFGNDQVFTYLNFFGTVLTIAISVPYLFHHVLKGKSSKDSVYQGQSGIVSQPVLAAAGAVISERADRTGNLDRGHLGQNTLKFQAGPKAGDTIGIGHRTYSVGRSPDNDIVIDDATVSRHHAQITFDDNNFYIEDLNSTAGTRINGRKVAIAPMGRNTVIKLGNTEVCFNGKEDLEKKSPPIAPAASPNAVPATVTSSNPTVMPWLAGTAGVAIGQAYHLKQGNNIIGRSSDSDLVVDDPYVSGHQAIVRTEGATSYLFDLGSSGGTKVNGKEVDGALLEPSCVIKVGETELSLLQVDDPKQFAQATMSNGTMVDRKGQQVGLLVVKSGVDAGKSFMLSEGSNTIGRGNGATISLSDKSISQHHAVIRHRNGKLVLLDVGSKGGTMLNGQRIGGHPLRNGDVISVGRSELTMMTPTPQRVGM